MSSFATTSRPIRLILTGATGFAGNAVLDQALDDSGIERVVVLTRRALPTQHPKLKQVVLEDFTDYSNVDPYDLRADARVWCLGVSQTAVDKQEYVRITVDYTLAAARALLTSNPDVRFRFMSGSRADQQEQSKVYYGRIKGRTGKLLSELTTNAFHFRPEMIREPGGSARPPLIARLLVPPALLLDRFSEQVSVECRQLAACTLDVAKHGIAKHDLAKHDVVSHSASQHVFDNRDIKRWEPEASRA